MSEPIPLNIVASEPIDAGARLPKSLFGGLNFVPQYTFPQSSPGASVDNAVSADLLMDRDYWEKLSKKKDRARRPNVLTRAQCAELMRRVEKTEPEIAEFALVYILQQLPKDAKDPAKALFNVLRVVGEVYKLFPPD